MQNYLPPQMSYITILKKEMMTRLLLNYSLCAFVLALGSIRPVAAATENTAEQLISDFKAGYERLALPYELEVSYQKHIEQMLAQDNLVQQRAFFNDASAMLKALQQESAVPGFCEKLDLDIVAYETALNLKKLDLIEAYKKSAASMKISDQGIYHVPMGREWYLYLLQAWLSLDVKPDQLRQFGQNELREAQARYLELQKKMGYAGKDQDFAAYLNGKDFFYPDGQTPESDYRLKQAIVEQHMPSLFLPTGIQAPAIAESKQGAAFPVDAYYEIDEKTFYYNKSRTQYGRRGVDMLLLHESTPGHHFQISYAKEKNPCASRLPPVFYSAFAEGWGAYVEQFGKKLGLYQSNAEELGAVEWDLVRSIRVVLDIGINYEGWTQEQAMNYWHKELPMLPELAQREIARVRNWPGQAITYKLGAATINSLRQEMAKKQGSQFRIQDFHDQVLKYGVIPLSVLEKNIKSEPAR